MKVLVIPDVHLKPKMFSRASALMKQYDVQKAVCLMDIPDDWNQGFNVALYEETYDAAIEFAREYPETLWCYGNHDLSYIWHRHESGYSPFAEITVQKKLLDLKTVLPENNTIKYIQRIDNVLFAHGGVLDFFVKEYVSDGDYDDVDKVLETINGLGKDEIWSDASPIWFRPQYSKAYRYKADSFLQVVGHTPVEEILSDDHLISCDVFSTYSDGSPIGTKEFLLLDTLSWEFKGIQ